MRTANQHIRMISEASCDCRNDAENSALKSFFFFIHYSNRKKVFTACQYFKGVGTGEMLLNLLSYKRSLLR